MAEEFWPNENVIPVAPYFESSTRSGFAFPGARFDAITDVASSVQGQYAYGESFRISVGKIGDRFSFIDHHVSLIVPEISSRSDSFSWVGSRSKNPLTGIYHGVAFGGPSTENPHVPSAVTVEPLTAPHGDAARGFAAWDVRGPWEA
jgi:hypothetical protein